MRTTPALGLFFLFSAACSSTATPSPASDVDAAAGTKTDGGATGPTDATVSRGPGPKIPKPTGTCPAIVAGDVTFAPSGAPPRKVNIALDASAASDKAALLIYWHATGSSTAESAFALGASQAAFTAGGGIVVTPYADKSAGRFEWFIVNQSPKLDDFLVADEVVACLAEARRIDPTRVHSMGMSAGGLQTTAFGFLRSSYVASVATFSGGLPPDAAAAPSEAPDNKFAALIFNGGATDSVFGIDFAAASERYRTTLNAAGHFTAICDHGKGHNIPRDAAPSVIEFFGQHPFGVSPSPYASGLPKTFPTYCKL